MTGSPRDAEEGGATGSRPADSLPEWLMARAQDEVTAALDAYSMIPIEATRFYLHAGMAVEFAFKAVLADTNLLLIADPRHKTSMWELATSKMPIESLAPLIRTAQLPLILDRIRLALPGLGRRAEFEAIAQNRNASVHMGFCSGDSAREGAVAMIAGLRAAVEKLGHATFVEFMGDYAGLANDMLTDLRTDVETDVVARIAGARRRYQERYSGWADTEYLAKSLHAWDWSLIQHPAYPCPACDTLAVLSGEIELVEHEHWDADGNPSFDIEPVLWPERFKCRACDLEFRTMEELDAAGIDRPFNLDLTSSEIHDLVMDAYAELLVDGHMESP